MALSTRQADIDMIVHCMQSAHLAISLRHIRKKEDGEQEGRGDCNGRRGK